MGSRKSEKGNNTLGFGYTGKANEISLWFKTFRAWAPIRMTQNQVVTCQSCRSSLKVPGGAAKVRCPKCSGVIQVGQQVASPNAAPSIDRPPAENPIIRCPACTKKLRLPNGAAGNTIQCPSCMAKIRAPGQAQPQPSQVQPVKVAPTQPIQVQPVQVQPQSAPAPVVSATPIGQPGGFHGQPSMGAARPGAPQSPYAQPSPYATQPSPYATQPSPYATGRASGMSPGLIYGIVGAVCFVCCAIPFLGAFGLIFCILGVGVVSSIAGIWILVLAFQDDTTQGVLALLVPFYILIYMINNWDYVKQPGVMYVASLIGMLSGVTGFGVCIAITAAISIA